jgi:hypothetical protein
MGFETGERAAIDGITCLRSWKMEESGKPGGPVWCSASGGGPVGVVGNDDWQGVAVAVGHTPARLPGDAFTFTGDVGNGKGVSGSALCVGIGVNWNVEGAELIYHEIYFAGDGALTRGAYSEADAGTPNPVSAKGLYAAIDSVDFAIRQAKFVFESPPAEYNDSSTAGHTNRVVGPYRGSVVLRCYFDDFDDLPEENTFVTLALQVSVTQSWLIDYIYVDKVLAVVEIAGPDGRAVGIEATIQGTWFGYYGTAEGQIVTPAGVTLWPETGSC